MGTDMQQVFCEVFGITLGLGHAVSSLWESRFPHQLTVLIQKTSGPITNETGSLVHLPPSPRQRCYLGKRDSSPRGQDPAPPEPPRAPIPEATTLRAQSPSPSGHGHRLADGSTGHLRQETDVPRGPNVLAGLS